MYIKQKVIVKRSKFFFLLLIYFSVISFAQKKIVEFLVDDFETRSNLNYLGGLSGAWEKDPQDRLEYCKSSFDLSSINKKETNVLRLEYRVDEQSYNGYYTKLQGLNANLYTHLFFYIKSEKSNNPKLLKIEIKNIQDVGTITIDNISTEWKKVTIPLENFKGINNFNNLKELVFVFDGNLIGNSAGIIYIDDIGFSAPEDFYKEKLAIYQNEQFLLKEEIRRIAEQPTEEFLDIIERLAFNYFKKETHPITGFIRDRNLVSSPSSIAATGFGIVAMCIGVERKWISYDDALRIVYTILRSLIFQAENYNGVYYHFIDVVSGKRVGNSEVSSVDTALLLGGVLVAREYFKEQEIKLLADQIYRNVNWQWMMDRGSYLLRMGWDPETGFSKYPLWDKFAEMMVMYILAFGAPIYSIPEKAWDNIERVLAVHDDLKYIQCESESLFTYQYSHAFIDFRNIHDKYANYWQNSTAATKYNYIFCKKNSDRYRTYKENFWGLSACDGPYGYKNYGATPFTHDGTVAPYAVCASIPHMPEICIETLRKLLKQYGEKIWGNYGFKSAFNLDKNWFSDEYVGIDVGITLLMIENYRSEFVWKYFMKSPYVKAGLKKAGFKEGVGRLNEELLISTPTEVVQLNSANAYYNNKINVDGILIEWQQDNFYRIDPRDATEFGAVKTESDLDVKFSFCWDEKYLYLAVKVQDDNIIAQQQDIEIYRDDCIEVFINTEGPFLIWGSEKNFQIGFAPDSREKRPASWAWFQMKNPKDYVVYKFSKSKIGYDLEAKIDWTFLNNYIPKEGYQIGFSVAVKDVDSVGETGKKINYAFKITKEVIKLGTLIFKQ